jgi:hypothetical protein
MSIITIDNFGTGIAIRILADVCRYESECRVELPNDQYVSVWWDCECPEHGHSITVSRCYADSTIAEHTLFPAPDDSEILRIYEGEETASVSALIYAVWSVLP